jgi:peptide-methionine (S)-S-oxide reductase
MNIISSSYDTAYFAGGCFWHIEDVFRTLPGVVSTKAGYMGGITENPSYEDVCTDMTGHAQTVQIVYHQEEISYQDLLKVFWKNHDPTSKDRQGADKGSQYRSVIFFTSKAQEEDAWKSLKSIQKKYSKPIVTDLIQAKTFWPAEEYHQKYYLKNSMSRCLIKKI